MLRCKICDAPNTSIKHIGNTELVFCKACKVAFLATLPSQEQLSRYYENKYEITTQEYISTEKRRIFRIPEQIKLISKLARLKPPPASVLDVGCDKGYFLDEIRRCGYSVLGVEPSQAAQDYCRRIGIEVKTTVDEIKATYDIITMWHTLEHVSEPVTFLNHLCEHLDPKGIVAVRVPDFGCFWRKIFGDRWVWFQPQNHYFHYTMPALNRLLEQVGLDVIEIYSQRPNNALTDKAYNLAFRAFRKYWKEKISLRKKLARVYENITGVELWAIAVKK